MKDILMLLLINFFMKLAVPYYSQHDESLDEHWQKRMCGLVCLKMVLDFYKVQTPDLKKFLELALQKEAYHNPNGWIHDKLLEIAKDFGRKNSYRKEKIEDIHELVNFLMENKPVIVSIRAKKFKEEFDGKFHQVVLVGLERDEQGKILGFYYHDPDYLNQEGKNLFVSLEDFEQYWRKMAIFI
ncbi:MAG: C39 family peptidase [Patescibacteria group bacterium]